MYSILVAHSDASMRILFSEKLFEEGYNVTSCGNLEQLSELLETKSADLLIMNAALAGRIGIELFASVLKKGSTPPLLLCVNHSGIPENPLLDVAHYRYGSLSPEEIKNKVKKIFDLRKTHRKKKTTPAASRHVSPLPALLNSASGSTAS